MKMRVRNTSGVDMKDLEDAFNLFDEDKDGEITLDELQKVTNQPSLLEERVCMIDGFGFRL